jgi:Glyoxalase-like domain
MASIFGMAGSLAVVMVVVALDEVAGPNSSVGREVVVPGPLVQVIVLVEDLDGARRWAAASGLVARDGGRHPGRGTANVIVPLGVEYLELLAVVDPDEARSSTDGQAVLDALAGRGPGPTRWSLETDDVEAEARRLALPVEERRRVRPDGAVIRWRAVGVNEAWVEPWRCAFMAWADPVRHPARTPEPHPCGATGFAGVDVGVPDLGLARAWIGGVPPSAVVLHEGSGTGPFGVTIATPDGPLPVDVR